MARCLLMTSIFPPIHGGSAAVYHNMARCAAGSVAVLAPRVDYQTGAPVPGWEAFDRDQTYAVHRVELLRPRAVHSSSLWRSAWLQATVDVPLKLRLLAELVRLVRRERVRVLCIGELDSGSWIGPPARLLGCKVINYIHGEEITTDSPFRRFGRNRRRYLRRADAVVAVSEFTRRELIERMGVDPARIELIPNGIDTDRFRPMEKRPDLLRRYGLEGCRVVLSVGRLIERKGFDRMIEALALLRTRHPDLRHLIVGNGPYGDELARLAERRGVADRVVFAGAVPADELAAHYALADVFALPNRTLPNGDTEGFGLVFLEANACGVPAVAGRAGGVVEVVRDGVNGLTVDGDDPHAIAAAIGRLLSDPTLHATLRHNGLALAQRSDWRCRARQFQALCRRLSGTDPS